jgi:hypothetical protein
MSQSHELSYDTRIVDLLTNRRYSLAEVIARYSRANGVELDEADAYIKQLLENPTSNLRIDEDDEEAIDLAELDLERAKIAAQTLVATSSMLNSNIPAAPLQERLRRLAAAAVEDLEQFYFGGTELDEDDEDGHDHGHGHNHGQDDGQDEHDHHNCGGHH